MKTQNPFTGRSSGSLANVTASTYLGQNILKSKPLEVRNPKTDKQVNVRNVLARAAVLGKSLSANSGIAKRSARTGRNTQKTARTALLSAILSQKTGVAPGISLNSAGITLQGSGISPQEGLTATLTRATRLLEVNWPQIFPVGSLANDLTDGLLFSLDTGQFQSFVNQAHREDGELVQQDIDSSFLDSGKLGVFLMFDSQDGLRYDAVSSINVSVV